MSVTRLCDMTRTWVWHDSVTWLVHECDMRVTRLSCRVTWEWHDVLNWLFSSRLMVWLMSESDMPHNRIVTKYRLMRSSRNIETPWPSHYDYSCCHLGHCSWAWRIRKWHDSWVRVTWLMSASDMTNMSHVTPHESCHVIHWWKISLL